MSHGAAAAPRQRQEHTPGPLLFLRLSNKRDEMKPMGWDVPIELSSHGIAAVPTRANLAAEG